MALAKDHRLDDSMCLSNAYTYYESEIGGSPIHGSDQSTKRLYGIEDSPKKMFEEGDSPTKTFALSNSSTISSPSSSNSSGLGYPTLNFQHTSGSILSFEKNEHLIHQNSYARMDIQEDFSIWEDNNIPHNNKMATSSSHGSTRNGGPFGWLSPEVTATSSVIKDLGKEDSSWLKRRSKTGESTQAYKKRCTSPTMEVKPKISPSKDPQSIAAKNRRERISERLKILQELVPNGSKVDLVTMLEKAISYVKFLQLQVKVLATDEFWPAQGGKAPNLAQVKEAIDVILASQRDKTCTSN